MRKITTKQKKFLNVIEEYKRVNGYSSSVRELCEICKLSSTSTVHGYLNRLQDKGYITRKPESSITIVVNYEKIKCEGI